MSGKRELPRPRGCLGEPLRNRGGRIGKVEATMRERKKTVMGRGGFRDAKWASSDSDLCRLHRGREQPLPLGFIVLARRQFFHS